VQQVINNQFIKRAGIFMLALKSTFFILLVSCSLLVSADNTTITATNNQAEVYQAGRDITIQNLYKSLSYKALQQKQNNLQERHQITLKRLKSYPNDLSFQQEFKEIVNNLVIINQQLIDFKKDVFKLAEDFNKIPLNTERLKQAKSFFDQDEYQKARIILDAKAMQAELGSLLAKKQQLQQSSQENHQQLDDKANEYLLLAKLTAIDYSLPNRIKQTKNYFELALKANRSLNILFEYGFFLQKNNQYQKANLIYQETLKGYRQLAKNNPEVYLPDVAGVLNNFAILMSGESRRHKEAEKLFQEALTIRRQLAKNNPEVYLPDVAMTLNNLANLIGVENGRRSLEKNNPDYEVTALNNLAYLINNESSHSQEAEKSYHRQLAKNNPDYVATTLNTFLTILSEAEKAFQEALTIYKQLAQNNPAGYLSYVAAILNNLAILIGAESGRHQEAEKAFQEALTIYRQLAKNNPEVYLSAVAMTLHNFGILNRHKPNKKYLNEALIIRRQLVKKNRAIYQPDLIDTLFMLGLNDFIKNKNTQTNILLIEAQERLKPLAKSYPQVYGERWKQISYLLEISKTN